MKSVEQDLKDTLNSSVNIKHDNRPENLMVFRNQKDHVKYHSIHPEESGVYLGKRGDAV